MTQRILIFSIAMGADYSFYMQSIATYNPAFLRCNNSVLALVLCTDFVLETLQMAIYSAMTLTILHETSNRLTSYLQKIYFV